MKKTLKNTLAVTLCVAGMIAATGVVLASDQGKGAAQLIERKSGRTTRQEEWLKATIEERSILAEKLGENGAMRVARSKGWSPILDVGQKTVPQGPDLVYQGTDGVVHVIEAKGGSSPVNRAYGHEQGTPEWAVKSAERIAVMEGASESEKRAAVEVLKAAQEGKLQVHVVRTKHVLGEPKKAVIEQTVKCTRQASELAKQALAGLAGAGDAAVIAGGQAAAQACKGTVGATESTATAAEAAGGALKGSGAGTKSLRSLGKAAVGIGLVVDGGLRIKDAVETERAYETGKISRDTRNLSHAKNAAGMAAGWGGATGGAGLGAKGGAALGSLVCPGVGTVVGGVLGGITGGIGGYLGGEYLGERAVETVW